MNDLLEWLQEIYANDLCNGYWEHVYGFSITNIDNPGWAFQFDLADTDIDDIPMDDVFVENSEADWYQCWIREKVFHGCGGARNLTDILLVFQRWYLYASDVAEQRK